MDKKDVSIISNKITEFGIKDLLNIEQILNSSLNEPDITILYKGNKKRNKPIMVIFTGDWHIGSKNCDHKKLVEDIDYITSNFSPDDIRFVLLGDLIDNVYPKFKNLEKFYGYIPPYLQKDALLDLFNKIYKYVDAVCWGNHDVVWDEKEQGYSVLARLLNKKSIYLPSKGLIKYNVGKESYLIYVSHFFLGKSWFHCLQGNIRGWLESHADIVVSGHYHSYGYLNDFFGMDHNGKPIERHLIQVGTYNYLNDKYSNRFWNRVYPKVPCAILYNNMHKVLVFSDMYDAVNFYKNVIL